MYTWNQRLDIELAGKLPEGDLPVILDRLENSVDAQKAHEEFTTLKEEKEDLARAMDNLLDAVLGHYRSMSILHAGGALDENALESLMTTIEKYSDTLEDLR